jgi:hypothetical protein
LDTGLTTDCQDFGGGQSALATSRKPKSVLAPEPSATPCPDRTIKGEVNRRGAKTGTNELEQCQEALIVTRRISAAGKIVQADWSRRRYGIAALIAKLN